jgi:hypothetical protein
VPAKYAARTEVPESQSRNEIERTLTRFGADAFAYGWSADHARAQVMFELRGRRMRFEIALPDRSAPEFTRDRNGRKRTEAAMRAAYDQELRRLWRSLALVIKAKLEAVATGIVSAEEEFLSHVVLPDGSTVGQWVEPQLAAVYGRGDMPALLPGGTGA